MPNQARHGLRAQWPVAVSDVRKSAEGEADVSGPCEVCGREKARDWEQAAMVTALCSRHLMPGVDDTVCTRLGYERLKRKLESVRIQPAQRSGT
jgi:hypothetical protein